MCSTNYKIQTFTFFFSFTFSNFKPNRRNYVQICFFMALINLSMKSCITVIVKEDIYISPTSSPLSLSLSLSLTKNRAMMARRDMLVKVFMGFVYVNVILDYVESSYSGVSGHHDAMRRMALVKAAHIIRHGASQPQSYSTPLVIGTNFFRYIRI